MIRAALESFFSPIVLIDIIRDAILSTFEIFYVIPSTFFESSRSIELAIES